MNRFLAFLLALLCATVSVSSAVSAAETGWVAFTLAPERNGKVHATFREDRGGRHNSNWSTGFPPSQLIGLDIASFRSAGTRPLRFAIAREVGRLDCSGRGGNSRASGNCAFTPDPRFTQLLVSRGIGRPTRDQAFAMMAVGVRSELINALAAARYPTPKIGELIAMTAVGVTGDYIGSLARAGYRPARIDTLVQFRALGITPEFIGGFARMGYGNIPADELVQLRALNITPEFVAGFERLGYRRLPVDTLVQLKALNITPEFVRSVQRRSGETLSTDELVQLKIFGKRR